MNISLKIAAVAGLAVVAAGACSPAAVAPSTVVSPPVARSTAAASAGPSAVLPPSSSGSAPSGPLDTSTWNTYTSTRYGFTIGHPADWSLIPSDRLWAFPADTTCCPPPGTETFLSAAGDVGVSVWSAAVTPGTSADEWIQDYCQAMEANTYPPCTAPQTRNVAAAMDGHAGRLIQFSDDTQAFIPVGDRMYVVACWRAESASSVAPFGGAQRLLEGYLSTMRLLPGGPASPAPSATPRPSS